MVVQSSCSQVFPRLFTLGPEPRIAFLVLKPFTVTAPIYDPRSQPYSPPCGIGLNLEEIMLAARAVAKNGP